MDREQALLACGCVVATSASLFASFLPTRERDACEGGACGDTAAYFAQVYGEDRGVGARDWHQHNFFWDNAAAEVRARAPIATNLSLSWPPPKQSRSRLTAFPYPPDSHSRFWLVNFARGIKALLDNSRDAITFPGWLVSVYDPADPNANEYGKALAHRGLQGSQIGSLNGEAEEQWMEVIHACYPPPGHGYPMCDDGGYWLYMTPGTGVYWGTGKRWLVANNKIDAVYKMLDTDFGRKLMRAEGFTDATDFLASKLEGTGGGTRLVSALRSVIEAMQAHTRVPKITAFRDMAGGDARPAWLLFCTYACVGGVLLLAGMAMTARALGQAASGRRAGRGARLRRAGALGAATAAGALVFAAVGWYAVAEQALRGFGYVTLDQARAKSPSGGSVQDFVRAARDGTDMVANSLCMVQNYDLLLEQLARGLRLTSVVMHAQPNKSGSWAVEIMDVRALPPPGAGTEKELTLLDLGLCGASTDGESFRTAFKRGFERAPDAFLGYRPSADCDCDEAAVRAHRERTGRVADCTFCKGHISEALCMP